MDGLHSHDLRVLPIGTAVVTRDAVTGCDRQRMMPAGSVASVVDVPSNATGLYRVRFAGGQEAEVSRPQIEVLRHFQRDIAQPTIAASPDLFQYVIYRCVIGSRAYGLDHDASDVDRRGVYLPPADLHWSLAGVPDQIEDRSNEEAYWEIQKFLTLALKANPNVLEVLYSPLVEHVSPIGEQLLQMRRGFLSRLVYQTYNGYALSQFKKLQQDLRNRGTIKWKHAMHLIRLLIAGITLLNEETVMLDVGSHRGRLLAIRDGLLCWDEIDQWRLKLHDEFEQAFARTGLPERPDYAAANDFLLHARRSMVQ